MLNDAAKMKQQTKNVPKNVMKQPQPKTRNEATTAAAKKSSKEDILRSQNNEHRKEIVALIDERRRIKKDDKERVKEVSKEIKECIRDK